MPTEYEAAELWARSFYPSPDIPKAAELRAAYAHGWAYRHERGYGLTPFVPSTN